VKIDLDIITLVEGVDRRNLDLVFDVYANT
jgi:hypothetical protein